MKLLFLSYFLLHACSLYVKLYAIYALLRALEQLILKTTLIQCSSYFYSRNCGRIYVQLINRFYSDSNKMFPFVHEAATANKDPRLHNYEILTD